VIVSPDFGVTVTLAVASADSLSDARLELVLFDAQGRSCGSSTTAPARVDAGGRTTIVSSPFLWSCELPVETATIRATLFTLRTNAGGPPIRTEYAVDSFPVAFSLRHPRESFPAAMTIQNSHPAPGNEVVTTDLNGLQLTIGVGVGLTLPDARLRVDLLDGSGQQCGFGFTDPRTFVAGDPGSVTVDRVIWGCTAPTIVTSATLTLFTNRDVAGRMERTDYAVRSVPIAFALREFPPAPPGAPQSDPTIAELQWKNNTPGCGSCAPIPDEAITISCRVRDADGDSLTISITVTWDGRGPVTSPRLFQAGASSSPGGALHTYSTGAPTIPGVHPRATAECVAVDSRGATVRRTIPIPD
jgi:hypothetical protein